MTQTFEKSPRIWPNPAPDLPQTFEKSLIKSPRTCPGPAPDLPRTCPGPAPDLPRTCPGPAPDLPRTCPGPAPDIPPDLPRTCPGPAPDGGAREDLGGAREELGGAREDLGGARGPAQSVIRKSCRVLVKLWPSRRVRGGCRGDAMKRALRALFHRTVTHPQCNRREGEKVRFGQALAVATVALRVPWRRDEEGPSGSLPSYRHTPSVRPP
jgi:hypothetical protein